MPGDTDPIVIIGMAVEAPGDIDTAEAYWALLSQQREALGPFPPTGAGRSATCWPGHVATASRKSTTAVDFSPAQPLSIRRSSASHRERQPRWTRSSGWRCGLPGVR
ncbi:beta-ketoacyl synthase, N-terminal domain protein [Mycobacterium xenopi 4042]|uniref:Beta-ketoacyl synthase, N-terminal domain protein n=1 Tax=Mycobacterium xenopi 4042 TaxID=1299334 RepID=X8ARC7_MYCXE|nr:beta-ketoacyl synthase, N-terminal domain protein [Mycobacterium xenopi 4042]